MLHPLVERSICFYRTYIHIASRFRKVESGPIRLMRIPHLNPIQIRTSPFRNLRSVSAFRIPKKNNSIFSTKNEQNKTATIQQCDTCPSGRVIYSIPVVEIRLSFVLFAPVSFCSGPRRSLGNMSGFVICSLVSGSSAFGCVWRTFDTAAFRSLRKINCP